MTGFKLATIDRMTCCLALAMSGLLPTTTRAAEPRVLEREMREFKVSVDGKGRGKCTIEITRRDDGTDRMHIDASLNFNYVVYEYRYSSVGTEIWKNGRLMRLENTANYNGTKYVVKASSRSDKLQVTVGDKTSNFEPDVWVTSYWRLPDRLVQPGAGAGKGVVPAGGRRASQKEDTTAVVLLDSDKGQKLRGEVKRVGEEAITVAGKKTPCTHYRIAGDVQVNVWYDSEQRLVRQETVESGHKTVMELTRLVAD
jgi:hypothetical protein